MGLRVLTVSAVLLCWALPLRAQEPVELQFDAGRVTLSAQNVPVRAILAEWARLGGATIVNGDRVAGPAVTIELIDVPEQQALDVLLRSAAGYMLAPRRAESNGASAFDRILILAASAAPRNAPPAAVAAGPARPILRRPPASAAGDGNGDGNVFNPFGPQGAGAVPRGPGGRGGGPGGGFVPQPLISPPGAELLDPDDEPDSAPGPAAPAGVAPTPTNPFGIPFGSSARPGVVTPVPQPQQQQPAPNVVQ